MYFRRQYLFARFLISASSVMFFSEVIVFSFGYVGGVIAPDSSTLRHTSQQFQQIRTILQQLPQLPATCSSSFFVPPHTLSCEARKREPGRAKRERSVSAPERSDGPLPSTLIYSFNIITLASIHTVNSVTRRLICAADVPHGTSNSATKPSSK